MTCPTCCDHHWCFSLTAAIAARVCLLCGRREEMTAEERADVERGLVLREDG